MVPWRGTGILLAVFLLSCIVPAYAQEDAQFRPDGVAPEAGTGQVTDPPSRMGSERSPTLAELPLNVLRDQKFFWVRLFHSNRADLPRTAAILGAVGVLLPLDKAVGQELSGSAPGAGFAFSRRVGQWGGGLTDFAVSGGFYLVGRWRKDERARITGLLGLRAVADSMSVVHTLKVATQRPRPTHERSSAPNQNAEGEFFTGGSSFPSGHAAQAWALATVVAHQYRDHRWVPPVAYGLAGLVGVSRVTARKHFPTDVFLGSVFGYLIGRHVIHEAEAALGQKPGRWQVLPAVPPEGGMGFTLSLQF